jgi:hypothetical protein
VVVRRDSLFICRNEKVSKIKPNFKCFYIIVFN